MAGVYAGHFDAINSQHPGVLAELPLWKWAALVEHWAWSHVEEGKESTLQRDLDRPVNWMWMGGYRSDAPGALSDPSRWQENKAGESLLSVHRSSKG